MADQEINTQGPVPVIDKDWAYPKIYEKTILFADDTILKGHCQLSSISDELWVFPADHSLGYMDLIQIFTNTDKTETITCNESETERKIYVGYTRVSSINSDTKGEITICLTKPI